MPTKHLLSRIQLESLTSPTRLAIVQRLEMDKEATASELAHRMGRPLTSLYHHLKQLQAVGVLRIVAKRKGPRRPQAVYAMVADHLSSAEAVRTEEGRKIYARAAARVSEAGARAFSTAVDHGSPRFDGKHRNAMVRFFVLRADRKKIARLNKLLNDLEDFATQECEAGEELLLTLLLSPRQSKE